MKKSSAKGRVSLRDQGPVRAGWLATMTWMRARLEGTSLLGTWTRHAQENPRGLAAHLRTVLAVHNVDDLVTLGLPWWTYRAIDLVEGFLLSRERRAKVFEYGSGASTIWLARRAHAVVAVEHDDAWATRVRQLLTSEGIDNVQLEVVEGVPSSQPTVGSGSPSGRGLDFRAYVNAIEDAGGPFDLIAVDGRARARCLQVAANHLADDGLLLLDDSQRGRYQAVIAQLGSEGWSVTRARGPAPCDPLPRETVVFNRAHDQ